MLTNDQMKPNRFARLHSARKRLAFIRNNLAAGRDVYLCTYTKMTKFQPKHLADLDVFFKATKSGLYVARGRNWDSIDGCKLVAQDRPARSRKTKSA